MFCDKYLRLTAVPPSAIDVKAFLWPVYQWQVYLPKSSGRELNLFETTLLQLFAAAGQRNLPVTDIAQWLDIEPDMVAYIISAQLQPNGWLDEKGRVTRTGFEMLEGESERELTTGYIFQCAVTGKWMPRVCRELKTVWPEGEKGKVRFRYKRSSDRTYVPWVVREKKGFGFRPGEADLKEITRQYQQALWIAKNTKGVVDQNTNKSIESLKLNTKSKERTFLTVWGDTSVGYEWTMYDPFGLSTKASWLTQWFDTICQKDKALGQFALKTLTGDQTKLDYEKTLKKLKEQAQFKVLLDYPDIGRVPELIEILSPWLEQVEVIEHESSPRRVVLESQLNLCVRVLESLFSYLLTEFALLDPGRLPHSRARNVRQIVTEMVRHATCFTQEKLAKVMAVNAGRIYQAAIGNNSTARAQLAAIFLSIPDHPNHPMKSLLEDDLLFNHLYQLTHDRDDASHGELSRYTRSYVQQANQTTKRLLQLVLAGLKYHE